MLAERIQRLIGGLKDIPSLFRNLAVKARILFGCVYVDDPVFSRPVVSCASVRTVVQPRQRSKQRESIK